MFDSTTTPLPRLAWQHSFVEKFCATLVLLLSAMPTSEALTLCLPSASSPYSRLNDVASELNTEIGLTAGFCEGYYSSTDPLAPVTELSCDGEFGSMIAVRGFIGALHSPCRSVVARFTCGAALPVLVAPSQTVSLPCSSAQFNHQGNDTIRHLIIRECSDDLELIDQILSLADLVDGLLRDPALLEVCRPLNGAAVFNPKFQPTAWGCPKGLVKVSEEDQSLEKNQVGCAIPCPAPFYSQQEYSALRYIIDVLNTSSCFAIALGILSWMTLHKAVFPRVLVLNWMVATAFLHVGLLITTLGGGIQNVWCSNEYTFATQKQIQCGVQGAFMVYGALAAMFAWVVVLINSYLTLVRLDVRTQRFVPHYRIFTFGFPAVIVVVTLASGKMDYTPGFGWCFISRLDSGGWQYGLFYVHLYTTLLIGIALGTLTILHLTKHSAVIAPMSQKQDGNPRFSRKLGLVIFYTFLTNVVILAFSAHFQYHQSDFNSSITGHSLLCA
eukprot:c4337_g1_i2.p1 GENE.c4337_g1_i2~~c4337_g1_i2.p1  ORF type:complete len:498 (-),score=86.96 c4337_g1_i2:547-2040(-)